MKSASTADGWISSALADFILASARISFYVRVRIHTQKQQNNNLPHISSTSSKPCITSTIMRVARINPELNASRSVIQDSSLVQSLNFLKVSFFSL